MARPSPATLVRFARPARPTPERGEGRGPAVHLGGRPYRAPTGFPRSRESRRVGAVVSVAAHALAVLLALGPVVWASKDAIARMEQGAGGDGPAGGGGGGTRGTGGWDDRVVERLTFVVPPSAAPRAEVPVPETPKPEVVAPPVAPPVTPVAKPQPEIPPVTPPAISDVKTATPASGATVASSGGHGGGTGSDGSGGNGPGSGGGVGSGIGTGRGSGVGPGTGGGTQANYPPTPTEMFLPPFPVPSKVKGFHLIAEFDVDEAGRVRDMRFTQTRDGDYNRKLREILRAIRFRPGTTPNGTPVRMKVQIEYSF